MTIKIDPSHANPANSGPAKAVDPAMPIVLDVKAQPIFSGKRLFILLTLGAIFSKMLGLFREIGMAHMFGTSLTADAFRAALTGVFLPLVFLQNETVPTVMIPMYRDWRDKARAAQRLTALALTTTLLGSIIIGAVALASSYWVIALVGGFSEEARAMTHSFLLIMALGMPASVLLNVLSAGEIALGRSRLTTLRASALNLSLISGLLVVYLTGAVIALPIAFAIAFNGLAAWGFITLVREGVLTFKDLRWTDIVEVQKEFWVRIRPLLATPIAEQANVWIERLTASRLGLGAVSSLDYARAITESAVLFISQPLGLALLALPPDANPRERVEKLCRILLPCCLPACICLGIFGPEVVTFLFSRGAFNETAVELTGQALRGISVGLWATTIGWVLLRMLNSAGLNRQATLILLTGFAANIVCNLILSEVPAARAHGPLILGLGESLRGFIFLFGAAIMLGCGRLLVRLTLLTLPVTILMFALGWWIDHAMDHLLLKLIIAGLVCLIMMLAGLAMLGTGIPGLIFDRIFKRRAKRPATDESMPLVSSEPSQEGAWLEKDTVTARLLRHAGSITTGTTGVMLVLHRMAPEAEWSAKLNQGFYVNEAFIDRFLAYLKANDWDIVTVEEATRRIRENEFARNFVNFSLDDCYRDTFETVIPLFRKHQVPITIYVTTGIPDGTLALWAAGLEDILMTRSKIETADGPIDLYNRATRVSAYRKLFGKWDNDNPAEHYRKFCLLNGVDEAALHHKHAMSWEMLEAVRHDPCVEIGGHSISHPHIAALPRDEAVREMQGCMERLRERLSIPVRHFAFPYGQPSDCGEREFEIAREYGFGSTATTSKELLSANTNPLSLPRINVNGKHQSLALMEAHLSGLTSLLARYNR